VCAVDQRVVLRVLRVKAVARVGSPDNLFG
jgi:hypothetical protein